MAAKLLKLRRGTTTQHGTFTGAEGECTVDMDKDVLVIHDGTTQGGHPLAAEDMSNVSSAHIAGRLNNDSIATSKIAAGDLPTDVVATAFKTNRAIGAESIASSAVVNRTIANNAVTFAKVENITPNQVLGRINSGTGNVEALSPAHVRTIINVENGATGDQTAAEIRTLVESASDSNVFTDADHTKLNAIEASATADQTAAEIRTLVESASDSNVFTDADHTKLNGIQAGATDNQTAAEIKTLLQSNKLTSSEITSGTIGSGLIANNAVTMSKIVQVNQNRIIGRIASGSGDVTTLTAANVRSMINVADGATSYTSNQATNTSSNVTFGTIDCSSLTATGNVTAYSDATLKTDIHTINEALGIVGKLRGVTYKWLSNGEADIGVIAQEVQEVVPEVIKETVDGIKTVDYGRLVSVLINAVNELNEKLDKHIEGGK